MAEDEYSPVPSGLRRKPEEKEAAGLEEMIEERQQKTEFAPPELKMPEMKLPEISLPLPSVGGGGGISKLAVAALLVALVALYFAYSANSQLGAMRGAVKGIVSDLKEFRDAGAQVKAPVSGKVRLAKDVQLSNVFPPGLEATGTVTIPIKTTLVSRTTTGTLVEIPIDTQVEVPFTSKLDFSKTTEGQSGKIDEEIPLQDEAIITVMAKEVWGGPLGKIISRLEKLSQ